MRSGSSSTPAPRTRTSSGCAGSPGDRPLALDIVPRSDLGIVAVQGPAARARAWQAVPGLEEATAALRRFQGAFFRDWFVGRTGYTGEDGFEMMLPALLAPRVWRALAAAGVKPCGLGARDTL